MSEPAAGEGSAASIIREALDSSGRIAVEHGLPRVYFDLALAALDGLVARVVQAERERDEAKEALVHARGIWRATIRHRDSEADKQIDAAVREGNALRQIAGDALDLAWHVYGFAYHEPNTRYVRGEIDKLRAALAAERARFHTCGVVWNRCGERS